MDSDAVNDFWCVIEGLVLMFSITLVFPFLEFLHIVVSSFIGIGPHELLYFVKHVGSWFIDRVLHYWPALVVVILFAVMDVLITLGIGGRLRLLAKTLLIGLLTVNPIVAALLFAFFRGLIQTLEPFYAEKIRARLMRRVLGLGNRLAGIGAVNVSATTANRLKIIALYIPFSLGISITFYGILSLIPGFVPWIVFVYAFVCICVTSFQRSVELRKIILSAIPPFGVTVYIAF